MCDKKRCLLRHQLGSLLSKLPQSRDAKLLKDISEQEHLRAGRRCSQLCSLPWTGFPTSVSRQTTTDGLSGLDAPFTYSCSARHLYFWSLIPLKVNSGPNSWLQDIGRSRARCILLILTLAILPNSHHYCEPFLCLNKGPRYLLWSGKRIPLTWLMGTFSAFSSGSFQEHRRNDYSVLLSVSNRSWLTSAENSRNVLPLAGGGKMAIA